MLSLKMMRFVPTKEKEEIYDQGIIFFPFANILILVFCTIKYFNNSKLFKWLTS